MSYDGSRGRCDQRRRSNRLPGRGRRATPSRLPSAKAAGCETRPCGTAISPLCSLTGAIVPKPWDGFMPSDRRVLVRGLTGFETSWAVPRRLSEKRWFSGRLRPTALRRAAGGGAEPGAHAPISAWPCAAIPRERSAKSSARMPVAPAAREAASARRGLIL